MEIVLFSSLVIDSLNNRYYLESDCRRATSSLKLLIFYLIYLLSISELHFQSSALLHTHTVQTIRPLGSCEFSALLKGISSVAADRGQSVTSPSHILPFAPEIQPFFFSLNPLGYGYLVEHRGQRGLSS